MEELSPLTGIPAPVAVVPRGPGVTPRSLTRREPEALVPLLPSQEHPLPVRVAGVVEGETVAARQLAGAVQVALETPEAELRVLLTQAAAVAAARSMPVSAQVKVLAAGVVL